MGVALFIRGGHNARSKRAGASIIVNLLVAVLFRIFRGYYLLCRAMIFFVNRKIGWHDLHFESFRLMLLVLLIDVISSKENKVVYERGVWVI